MGKPSASAILAASVGLFSYHVNRRRRPVGGGEAAAALSEKGKKTTRGRGVSGLGDAVTLEAWWWRWIGAIKAEAARGRRRRRRRRSDKQTDRAGRWREQREEPERCRP